MENQKPLPRPTESKSTFFTDPQMSPMDIEVGEAQIETSGSQTLVHQSHLEGSPKIQVSGPYFQNVRFSSLGWSPIICPSNKMVPVRLAFGDRGPVILRTTALKETERQNHQQCHGLITRKSAF